MIKKMKDKELCPSGVLKNHLYCPSWKKHIKNIKNKKKKMSLRTIFYIYI